MWTILSAVFFRWPPVRRLMGRDLMWGRVFLSALSIWPRRLLRLQVQERQPLPNSPGSGKRWNPGIIIRTFQRSKKSLDGYLRSAWKKVSRKQSNSTGNIRRNTGVKKSYEFGVQGSEFK